MLVFIIATKYESLPRNNFNKACTRPLWWKVIALWEGVLKTKNELKYDNKCKT